MIHMLFKRLVLVCGVFGLFIVLLQPVRAQERGQSSKLFEAQVHAVDAGTLLAGKTFIRLWGVQAVEAMPAPFLLMARTTLDNVIGTAKVRCEMKQRTKEEIFAQCTNATELDLGLYMLQQGFVTVDRGAVLGSPFEGPYLQAEARAQNQEIGVWSEETRTVGGVESSDNSFLMVVGSILLVGVLGAFAALSMAIMRGFQRVSDAQRQNMDMIARERALKDKERQIFATMLDSEIKANKSKIEAYLVVYDEMLKELRDPDRNPKYKKAGDIVQVQPSLDRSVFDRNTDKLDILGNQLSSEVIHFYARIKSRPDYENLEPDMPLDVAVGIVEKAYKNAERLNQISDRLIDSFEQGGHSSEKY